MPIVFTVEIQGKGAKDIRVNTSPAEITMRQWVDFHLYREDLPQWILEATNESVATWTEPQWVEYYRHVMACVDIFTDTKLSDLLSIPLVGIMDNEEGQNGLLAVYKMIVNSISTYEPQERETFEYKGKTFKIPERVTNFIGQTTLAPDITTGEAIEALQAEHVLNAKNEDGEFALSDRKYHTDLAVVSAICRLVNPDGTLERVPNSLTKWQRFMDKRVKFFEDLTMDIALDVAFFLIVSKLKYLNIPSSAMPLIANLKTSKKLNVS